MGEEAKKPETEPTTPNAPTLTPEQLERLQGLQSEILFDRITVSFSLDTRDEQGRRKSAFYSASVTRKQMDGVPTEGGTGFTADEERMVHAIVAKRVVATVYGDAVIRKMIPGDVARAESRAILDSYDRYLAGLMNKAKP